MKEAIEKTDIYEKVTNLLIEKIEQGVAPWRKTWAGVGTSLPPYNYATKRRYHGINNVLLSMLGYGQPYFLTFKQAQELGGHVKKGAKGHMVIFWKILKLTPEQTEDNTEKQIPYIKYSYVFHVEDIEGIEFDLPKTQAEENKNNPIEACVNVVATMPKAPAILHQNQESAYYSPSRDIVNMPKIERFESSEEYYSTLFHELIHSTGHETRLNREGIKDVGRFGSPVYSKEELVAEFGAAFLCQATGIQNNSRIENSAAYLKGWLKALKEDKKMLVEAASKAQKAADFILNRKSTEETTEEI